MSIQANRPTPSGLHRGVPYSRAPAIGDVVELIGREMAESEQALDEVLRETTPAVAEINAYLAHAGGKRLRPMLTALGARAAGHAGPLARLMCVGEVVHLGSLLHDDVVDAGHERRGMPAAWRVFGNPGVILAGDFCISAGLLIAVEEAGIVAARRLAETFKAMAAAELTQLIHSGDFAIDRQTYFQVIRDKSASLIAWCAAAGAWAVDDLAAAEALEAFGLGVGEAFQIADDVLDYVGDEQLTGKKPGRDLMEGKLTLPLLLAVERSPGIADRIGSLTEAEVPELLAEVHACGATADALAFAHRRAREGIAALDALPDNPYRRALEALAHLLVERSA